MASMPLPDSFNPTRFRYPFIRRDKSRFQRDRGCEDNPIRWITRHFRLQGTGKMRNVRGHRLDMEFRQCSDIPQPFIKRRLQVQSIPPNGGRYLEDADCGDGDM
jgi:hypothetical protein